MVGIVLRARLRCVHAIDRLDGWSSSLSMATRGNAFNFYWCTTDWQQETGTRFRR
jgi:hypothetical protein